MRALSLPVFHHTGEEDSSTLEYTFIRQPELQFTGGFRIFDGFNLVTAKVQVTNDVKGPTEREFRY